jgi:hypothetical protein
MIPEPIMQNIHLDSTERSPAVDFAFDNGHLRMRGESYPEDAAAFFGPLLQALRDHAGSLAGAPLVMDLELTYFNSSSAKALMNMFQILEDAAAGGATVTINWHYNRDDDAMEEFGEDFAEDFENATFHLCPRD